MTYLSNPVVALAFWAFLSVCRDLRAFRSARYLPSREPLHKQHLMTDTVCSGQQRSS